MNFYAALDELPSYVQAEWLRLEQSRNLTIRTLNAYFVNRNGGPRFWERKLWRAGSEATTAYRGDEETRATRYTIKQAYLLLPNTETRVSWLHVKGDTDFALTWTYNNKFYDDTHRPVDRQHYLELRIQADDSRQPLYRQPFFSEHLSAVELVRMAEALDQIRIRLAREAEIAALLASFT